MCEVCKEKPAASFSLFENDHTGQDKQTWNQSCDCTTDDEKYYVLIDKFFKSPASTVDWISHLHKKPEMDWKGFTEMMHRFRSAMSTASLPELKTAFFGHIM